MCPRASCCVKMKVLGRRRPWDPGRLRVRSHWQTTVSQGEEWLLGQGAQAPPEVQVGGKEREAQGGTTTNPCNEALSPPGAAKVLRGSMWSGGPRGPQPVAPSRAQPASLPLPAESGRRRAARPGPGRAVVCVLQ